MSSPWVRARGIFSQGYSAGQLWRKAWDEYPEVTASCFMGLFGVCLTLRGLRKYYLNDGDNRLHRYTMVVMRPTDPRAAHVRRE